MPTKIFLSSFCYLGFSISPYIVNLIELMILGSSHINIINIVVYNLEYLSANIQFITKMMIKVPSISQLHHVVLLPFLVKTRYQEILEEACLVTSLK